MERKVIVNEFDNPAKKFEIVLKNLREIAIERDIFVTETIKMLITDLQNLNIEGYEKKLEEISIENDTSSKIKKDLINYLNKSLKKYSKIEKNNMERKKQEARKQKLEEIWKSIEEIITDESNKEVINDLILEIKEGSKYSYLDKTQKNYVLKKLEKLDLKADKKKNNKDQLIEKKWKAIVKTVNDESEKSGRHKLEIWDMITESIVSKGKIGDLNISETIRNEVLRRLEEQTKNEGKEYFENIKKYTHDFEFLEGFRGTSFASYGHRKISNPEYSRMFENLVSELRKNHSVENRESEEKFLERVLSENKIHTYYGNKIVEERIAKIKKEKEIQATR